MESTVVSISRTLAAGGEEIGRLVARELDFRYVDDEIMSQSLITRILEAMETGAMMEGIAIAPQVAPVVPESRLYQNLIKRVIHGTAEAGKVVFVAHGTSIPLAGMSGLLRVFVTASPEVRAERLMALTDVGEPQAIKAIQDSDRERQKFFRRFYNLRQELPTQYDLVVNTDRFTVSEAVRLIVVASKM